MADRFQIAAHTPYQVAIGASALPTGCPVFPSHPQMPSRGDQPKDQPCPGAMAVTDEDGD